MQVTTANLKVGMMVINSSIKGVMTVASISDPLESMPVKYRISFAGIRELMLFSKNEIFDVINEEDFNILVNDNPVFDKNTGEFDWNTWKNIGEILMTKSDLTKLAILMCYLNTVPLQFKKNWDIDYWVELMEWADEPAEKAFVMYMNVKKA